MRKFESSQKDESRW